MNSTINALVFLLFVSSTGSADEFKRQECEVPGQFILQRRGATNLVLLECQKTFFMKQETLSPEDYIISDLAKEIEPGLSDKKLVDVLVALDIGNSREEAIKAMKDFKGGGNIFGTLDQQAQLNTISKYLNDKRGIPEKIRVLVKERELAQKQEDLDEQKRLLYESQILKVSKKSLAELEYRSANSIVYLKNNCSSVSEADLRKLEVIKVKFDDGKEALILPLEVRSKGDKVEFLSPSSGSGGIGGIRFGKAPLKWRYLRFEGEKAFWGVDGQEYPIKSFHPMRASDSLGFTRPFGNTMSDSCLLASYLEDNSGAGKNGTGDAKP